MPICGRRPKECFDTFEKHIGPLIQGVLGRNTYVLFERIKGDEAKRSMKVKGARGADWVRLDSPSHGEVYLYLAQDLVAQQRPDGKAFELKTRQYWYWIYEQEPGPEDEALFRWENAPLAGKKHCKYHCHVGKTFKGGKQEAITLDRNGVKANLTRLHIPTGYVLIEYVLRFLIVDLGIKPACGEDRWEEVLSDSEDRFFKEFSPKST